MGIVSVSGFVWRAANNKFICFLSNSTLIMDLGNKRPRINASLLAGHQGQGVTLLGMAHSVDPNGQSFQMKSSDLQNIHIILEQPLDEYVADLVEVHGTVQPNNSVLCHNYVQFDKETSQNFDLEQYDKAVQMMHQLPQHYVQGISPA